MAAHDDELGKIEHDVFQIRNKSSGIGSFKRTGVPNLGAKGYTSVDTRRINGIVAPIVRRQIPEPGDDADPDDAVAPSMAANFARCFHGLSDIDPNKPAKTRWGCRDLLGKFLVGNQATGGAVPG